MRHKSLHRFLSICCGQNPISVLFKQHFPTLKHSRCVIRTEDHWLLGHGCPPILGRSLRFKESTFFQQRILALVIWVPILLDEGWPPCLGSEIFPGFRTPFGSRSEVA